MCELDLCLTVGRSGKEDEGESVPIPLATLSISARGRACTGNVVCGNESHESFQ